MGARVALANQLRAELERFWPGPIGLFSAIDSPISLAFLARYPSPPDARGLGEKRMAAFLKAQHYSSRKTAAELLDRVRSAAAGRAGEVETHADARSLRAWSPRYRSWSGTSPSSSQDLTSARRPPRWGDLPQLLPQPRVGGLCRDAAREIGDCRARYPHRDAIAADAGQAPVAKESGKRKWRASELAIELRPFFKPSLGGFGALNQEDVMMESGKQRKRRQLSPEEKWEIFLEVTSQELSQADAARKWNVDVSTVVRLRQLARDAALAAFASSKPGRMPSVEQVELEAALGENDRLAEALKEMAIELTLHRGKQRSGFSARSPRA